MLLCGLYLDTVDPKTNFKRLVSKDVLISIVLHTIIYLAVIYAFTLIFDIKLSSKVYTKISIALLIVMVLGYFGRLARSKSIYNAHIARDFSEEDARKNTINLMNHGYFKFYFLG